MTLERGVLPVGSGPVYRESPLAYIHIYEYRQRYYTDAATSRLW